ncbi:MAG: FliM/FliN family flagellar motor switch protein [Planctomycetes bacterium]|nr:FliM/FliN family flagellar motor switch protein [Planctomycetota bacterium]
MSVVMINPEIVEKGNRIAKALIEGGSAGWSTLIGKNIVYDLAGSDYGRLAEIVKPDEIGEAVATPVDWSGEYSGKIHLLVPAAGAKEVVAYMMALMLGGAADPAATKLDVEGMDAYSEATNSFFGQGAQQARGEIGGVIKTTVGTSRLVDFSKTAPADELGADDYLCVKIKVSIDGRPTFTLLMLISRSVTGVQPETDPGQAAEEAKKAAENLGVNPANLAIAMKVKLPVVVCIATKNMRMELIQALCPGSIIEFRKKSEENLDVLATNVKVATAEAVTVNQCFGVQIHSIVDPRAAVKD